MNPIKTSVQKYYEETRSDYNNAWFTHRNFSIHFGFYDENATTHDEAVMNTNRVMAEVAKIENGNRVLDAGCGVGGAAFWLVNNREVYVVGVTPVAHQVQTAKQKAVELSMAEQVEFHQASFLQLPFPDETFDVVWACESICHAESKLEFYREAFRVLRPGGRLVIAEYMRFKRPMKNEKELKLLEGLAGWAIHDIDSGKEHFEQASLAGFEQIEIRDMSKYVRVSFRNLYRHVKRWLWLGKVLRAVGMRSSVQHGNLVGSLHISETFLHGDWFYGLLTAHKK